MENSKKIEIFDKCINSDLQDYLDKLDDNQLDNLCGNLNSIVTSNPIIVKVKIKSMSKRKPKM